MGVAALPAASFTLKSSTNLLFPERILPMVSLSPDPTGELPSGYLKTPSGRDYQLAVRNLTSEIPHAELRNLTSENSHSQVRNLTREISHLTSEKSHE